MGATIQDGGMRERSDVSGTTTVFFFFVQQFITQGAMADHGNYLVATIY